MRRLAPARLTVVGGCIVVGAMFFLLSDIRAEINTPVPVIIPFPPAGRSITESFSIRLGGRFEARIITAAAPRVRIDASRAGQPIRCNAAAVVTGSGFRITQRLDRLEAFDWTAYTSSWTTDGEIPLPLRGDYLLTVTNSGSGDEIFSRGAFVQLARLEPNGADFTPLVLATLGYFFLLIAFLVLIATPRVAVGPSVKQAAKEDD